MQEPEEAATETEAQRTRRLGQVRDGCIVEFELLQALAQHLEVVGVDREQSAEHHGLGVAIPLQRLFRRMRDVRDRFTRTCFADILHTGDEIPHLTCAEFVHFLGGRATRTDFQHFVFGAGLHEQHLVALAHATIHHSHARHHTAVLVVLTVEDQRLQRRVRITLRRRNTRHHGVQQLRHTFTRLRRDTQDVLGGNAEHLFDFHREAIRVGCRKIDLVQCSNDLQVALQREITIGQGLCFDALSGIHHQHHAFARSEGTAHFVTEVHVPGSIDEVQHVVFPRHAHVLCLDGDAALTLQIHGVQVLRAHVTGIDGLGELQNSVRQGGLAVVDVRNNREVADAGLFHEGLFHPTEFRAETCENSTLHRCAGTDDARHGWRGVCPSGTDDALVA